MLATPSLPFKPRAVLFDLDGTLVDSERDVAVALDEVLRRRGRVLTEAEKGYIIGHGWGEIHAFLVSNGGVPLSLAELEDEVFEVRLERVGQGGVTVLPGAVELVRRVSAKVPCALVTGSSRKEADLMLDALKLRGAFHSLVCAGEYPRGKPAPDPYLTAAQALSVSAASCLVLEDSTAGIASARAAGMFCIALRAGNFALQDQSAANLVLESMVEVDGLLKWG